MGKRLLADVTRAKARSARTLSACQGAGAFYVADLGCERVAGFSHECLDDGLMNEDETNALELLARAAKQAEIEMHSPGLLSMGDSGTFAVNDQVGNMIVTPDDQIMVWDLERFSMVPASGT